MYHNSYDFQLTDKNMESRIFGKASSRHSGHAESSILTSEIGHENFRSISQRFAILQCSLGQSRGAFGIQHMLCYSFTFYIFDVRKE